MINLCTSNQQLLKLNVLCMQCQSTLFPRVVAFVPAVTLKDFHTLLEISPGGKTCTWLFEIQLVSYCSSLMLGIVSIIISVVLCCVRVRHLVVREHILLHKDAFQLQLLICGEWCGRRNAE